MATFVIETDAVADGSDTIVLTIPAAVAVADLMIVAFHDDNDIHPTAPAGWHGPFDFVQGGAPTPGSSALALYWRFAVLGDTGGAVTVTIVSGSVSDVAGMMVVYRGVDLVTPYDRVSASQVSSGTALVTAALLTHVDNETVVTFYASRSATASVNVITGTATVRGSVSNAVSAALAVSEEVITPAGLWFGAPGGTGTGATSSLDGPFTTIDVSLVDSGGSTAPVFTSAAFTTVLLGVGAGFPVTTNVIANLTEAGSLPAGMFFFDLGGGTGILAGTPTVAGVYPIVLTATNSSGTVNQSFVLTATDGIPAFTSGATTTFPGGSSGTFTVITTGIPTAALTEVGGLPAGVTFVDNNNGTATLSGATTVLGVYPITITAANTAGSTDQSFTLIIAGIPVFTSAATRTFTTSVTSTFTVTVVGSPTPTLVETGALPAGVTFVDNSDGTATLAGTAAFPGVFAISIAAANTSGTTHQSFTLTIADVALRPNRWTLYDPVALESYTFEINPKAGPAGMPVWAKTFAYQSVSASDGGLVLWELQGAHPVVQFTGTILSQGQYVALSYWFTKPNAVVLTDDLGQVSTIYITGFTPKRIRTKDFPWHHDYTCDALYVKAGA